MALTGVAPVLPDEALGDRGAFEEWCRLRHAVNVGSVTVFGKWPMDLPRLDESLAPCLRRDGFWESWVSLAFARRVRPGAYVVDAGAHAGWFTLLALARGAARVLAIEPQPEIVAGLARTVADCRLGGRVDLWCGALGAAWGAEDLLLYGGLTGSASFLRAATQAPTGTLRVPVAPLDGLLDGWAPWPCVDIVKVDVEGAEAAAWAGMVRTLEGNPRVAVVMEVARGRGYDLETLVAWIEGTGFAVRGVLEDGTVGPLDLAWLDADGERWATLWLERE